VVPKHESRGLSIEKLVISLYAKGMSVSDIEEEMREIYDIELSTSAISIITNKVNQAAMEWQNRPLDPIYLIVWMVLYLKSVTMERSSTRLFTYVWDLSRMA
jgi:transposase-like protein